MCGGGGGGVGRTYSTPADSVSEHSEHIALLIRDTGLKVERGRDGEVVRTLRGSRLLYNGNNTNVNTNRFEFTRGSVVIGAGAREKIQCHEPPIYAPRGCTSYIHTFMYNYTCQHVCIYIFMHTCMHVYRHTYTHEHTTHTNTHTHHTYTHTHTHTRG